MDMIAIAPVPQPSTPSSQSGVDGAGSQESGFSLVFNEAVASTSKQTQSGQPSSPKSPDSAPTTLIKENQDTLEAIDSFLAELTPEQLFSLIASPEISQGLRTLLLSRFAEQTGQSAVAWFANGQQTVPAQSQTPLVNVFTDTVNTNTPIDSSVVSFTVEPDSVPLPFQNNGQTTAELLAHLQKLMGRSNDNLQITASFQPTQRLEAPGYLTGPLVIQAADTAATAVPQSAGTAESAFRPVVEVPPAPLRQDHITSDPIPKVAVLQQNVNEQKSETGGQQQTGQQHTGAPAQTSVTITQSMGDQSTPSTIFSAQFQEVSHSMESARSVGTHPMSPHVTQVQENDIIQQIVQRFSIQTHLQNSRLSLRLHPAELGALKIDVTVKDDALKAHIYAQTRQAQEVIEKHLPRLKAILEEHGMQVDDLLVTFSSDSLDSFSGQTGNSLAEQMAEFSSPTKHRGDDLFLQSLEEPRNERDDEQPAGVNLTV